MTDTPWDHKPVVPSDHETELMTLGTALASAEAAEHVVEELSEADFHLSAHRRIYQAIAAVFAESGAADHIEVAAWLRDRNDLEECGGLDYLARALLAFHTTHHVTRYASILRTLRVRREAMELAGAFYTRFRELQGDPSDSLQHFLEQFERLGDLARGGAPIVGLDSVAELLGTIEWTWPGWIPRGHISLICAAPGAGKSALALHLTRCVTTGEAWPDGAENSAEPQRVLYCDTEASHAFLVQRARQWGVPLSGIITPGRDGTRRIRLDEAQSRLTVRRAIREARAGLVVIDSLRGALTGDENSSDVADVLGPWAELAAAENVPMVLVHHTRKGGGRGAEMHMDQVRGSSALVAIARSLIGLAVLPSLDDGARRVRLQHVKSNFGPLCEPLVMIQTENGCDFSSAQQRLEEMVGPDDGDSITRAALWLADYLRDGPKPCSEAIKRCMDETGARQRTVYRARKRLGIRGIPDPDAADSRERLWVLADTSVASQVADG